MIGFIIGLLVGAVGIVLATGARRKQLFERLDQLIQAEEQRLAGLSSSSSEAAELRERIGLLRDAREGRVPMEAGQRLKVAISTLPSLALFCLLMALPLSHDLSGSAFTLTGIGIGAVGAQLLLRIKTLVWRPEDDGALGKR